MASDGATLQSSLAAAQRQPRLSPAAGVWPLHRAWVLCGLLPLGFSLFMALISNRFGYDRDVAGMPVLLFAGVFVAAGLAFAAVVPGLIERSASLGVRETSRLLALIVGVGVIARLVLFASQPILEDDYQRYLWDGAVVAHGFNPYAASPRAVIDGGPSHSLAGLATETGSGEPALVLRRINHPNLTTLYPPVTEAAFATAYAVSPWSLNAWRSLLLLCDLSILIILLSLLKTTGRSSLWAALYWWNPLVLKEGFNSAHMEPLVVALVMSTLWLAARRRPVLATVALGFAAGAKLWPVLLLPIILRATAANARHVIGCVSLFAAMLALWAAPILSAGLTETSGLIAYAEAWKTNSALFPLLQSSMAPLFGMTGLPSAYAAIAVKGGLACGLGWFAVRQAKTAIETPLDLIKRSALVVAALVVLSPAQYPWYVLWVTPFLAFWPSRTLLLMGGLVPLYYASFYFIAQETLETAGPILLGMIWLPVWISAALELWAVARNTVPRNPVP